MLQMQIIGACLRNNSDCLDYFSYLTKIAVILTKVKVLFLVEFIIVIFTKDLYETVYEVVIVELLYYVT